MATYDLTDRSDNAFTNASSIAEYPSEYQTPKVRTLQAYLDMEALIKRGLTVGAADVFQLLEIPANVIVLVAGSQVVKVFDGTSPTVDIDFAAGDDIIDGGDVTALGFLAAGTNGTSGTTIVASAGKNYTDYIATTDTIDVKLIAGSSDVTEGILRVYATVIDLSERAASRPVEAPRDQLA